MAVCSFPQALPRASVAMPRAMAAQDTPACCSARCTPCLIPSSPQRPGQWHRAHHIWQGGLISAVPTPAPWLLAHGHPQISLWELGLYSKNPKAVSLIWDWGHFWWPRWLWQRCPSTTLHHLPVSVYAVKCWQAQPWQQLQQVWLLSEQWQGQHCPSAHFRHKGQGPEWPAQSPHSQQGRGRRHRETNFRHIDVKPQT